jgi:hypothetical protein
MCESLGVIINNYEFFFQIFHLQVTLLQSYQYFNKIKQPFHFNLTLEC